MIKPYFEAVRIALNEDTKEEFEYDVMLLWRAVNQIEIGVDDEAFKNKASKTVIITDHGSVWVLADYLTVKKAWVQWLDAASNIQSVFTNN